MCSGGRRNPAIAYAMGSTWSRAKFIPRLGQTAMPAAYASGSCCTYNGFSVTQHTNMADASLLQYMDGLMDSLRHLAPLALEGGEPKPVHHARVGTRRMRAAMELVSTVLPPKSAKSLSRTLRKLRRRLGPLRDTDVMLIHLSELRTPTLAPAIAWMQRLLCEQRRDIRAKVAKQESPAGVLRDLGNWRKLEKEIRKSQSQLPDLLRNSAAEQLAAFAQQARKSLNAKSSAAPLDWHALRVAGKRLRYTLEMSAAAGHDLPPQTSKVFKKMQDALGLWHDQVVLSEQTLRSAVKQNLAMTNPQLLSSILSLVQESQRRASKQLKDFAKIWREDGEALTRQIRSLFSGTNNRA